MKAKTNSKKEQPASRFNNGEIVTIVLICITLLLLLFSLGEAKAQNIEKGKFGASISSTVTGSGHGTNYSPQIHYVFKNNNFSIGPNIQKRFTHLSGVQFNYERTVCSRSHEMEFDDEEAAEEALDSLFISKNFEDDFYTNQPYNKKVELFLAVNTIYHHNANLTEETIMAEANMKGTEKNISNFEYKTLENYVGFGLRIRFSDNLKWNNSIGIGGYLSSNGPCVFRMEQDASLLLRTSLCYTFK